MSPNSLEIDKEDIAPRALSAISDPFSSASWREKLGG